MKGLFIICYKYTSIGFTRMADLTHTHTIHPPSSAYRKYVVWNNPYVLI